MHAFIFAGGFATRLWPLTEARAKPLLPLAGRPLLTHLIEQLPKGLSITVSTNAAFKEGFASWKEELGNPDVQLMIEESRHDGEKLGALGALSAWLDSSKIQDDLLLLTGDNYFGCDMKKIIDCFDGSASIIAVHDIGDLGKASAFGTVLCEEESGNLQTVIGFEEKPEHPKTSLVSTGCSLIPKGVFDVVRAFASRKPDNVGGLFEALLSAGKPVKAYQFSEAWLDIGSFQSYIDAHRLVVGERLIAGDGSSVRGTQCRGSVAVGPGSRIERASLTDCMVFGNCVIEDCTLSECIVDEDCELRGIDLRGKMIRRGTKIVLPSD